MELLNLSAEEIAELFTKRIRIFEALSERDKGEVIAYAKEQIEREMPFDFILSGSRSIARRLAAEEEEDEHPEDLERQKFIEENALPPDERISAKSQPRKETKVREREALEARIRALLREARSAQRPHERRHMRRALLGVDQAKLRRTLGQEGQRMAEEIRSLLLRSTDLR
jgi:hypothetical protein